MATLTTTIRYSEPAGSIITSLGVPGPAGPGVPVGGAAGQILAKIDGQNYNTHWINPQDDSAVWGQITGEIANQLDLASALSLKLDASTAASTYQTLSGMSAYLSKAGNLAGLTDLAAARNNLDLGVLNSPTFAGLTVQGSGSNVGQLGATSLSLNHSVYGQFTISPAVGIVFPDSTVQVTAYTGDNAVSWGEITGQISSQVDLQAALNSKLSLSGGYITGNIQSNNGSQYISSDGVQFSANYGAAYLAITNSGIGGGTITVDPSGIKFPSSPYKQTTPFLGLDGYATESWVISQGYITSDALAPYLTSADAASTYAVTARGLPAGGITAQVLSKASNSDYSSTWTTIIPGDRYLTSSTTTNTVSNGTKTFTVQTGLSYTPTQDATISYDANNHMHTVVTSYNPATGVLVVDARSHTGSGTYSSWVVNVGGTVPATTVAWGSITGTISAQLDLQSALDSKLNTTTAASTYYLQSNPAGFITNSALAPYLLASTAASTYFTISAAAGKANLSGATFTGKVNLTTTTQGAINFQPGVTPASPANGDVWMGQNALFIRGIDGQNRAMATLQATQIFTAPQIIDTTATTAALRVTQKGTGNAIEVEDSTTPDTTRFVVDQFGKVGVGVAPDTNAAIKVDTNGIMFGDFTVQTTASPPFQFNPTGSIVSLVDSTLSVSFSPSYVRVTLDGTYSELNYGGIRFGDGSIQSTAAISGITDAPLDGNYYVRRNGEWYQLSTVEVYDIYGTPYTVFRP
jgi:hypothetical protein